VREKSNIKEIQKLKNEMDRLEEKYNKAEEKIAKLQLEEENLWVKTGICSICLEAPEDGYTEWHHIISQHKCKKEGLLHLISARSNVVELCKACHDLTTASMLRTNLEGATSRVSKENADKEPTDNQIKYIKKLGGDIPEGLTRQGASQLIDELKKAK
jgi:predicted  nucleic acid-binding Zn-ribbon protein|tara:strand:- start:465 stop:938 length:474 start_codon:yes stop_codon:yes gene_type:complete